MKKAVLYIKENNEKIINTWEQKVIQEIEASRSTKSLVLRNQLPHVLEDIAEILDRYKDFEHVQKDEKFEEIISNSIDHGRHRASSSHYSIRQILQEYMIFHRTLTDLLREANAYTSEVGSLLMYTIETAMINSADSFTSSLQEMREKLVGTLAHDLRNPISAAYLAIDMMEYDNGPERFKRIKRLVKRSMNNSLKLIEGLLDAISVKAGQGITMQFKETDLLKDINWVYQEASEIYPNPIRLISEQKKVLGVFDGTAIRRVLENLVSNGVKYGAENSPITITVLDKDKEVIIRVHNEGFPIPKQRQNEIFSFLKTKQEGNRKNMKSWGMGLYLVKLVVEAHGGDVKFTSSKKSGTTFEMKMGKQRNKTGISKARVDSLNP